MMLYCFKTHKNFKIVSTFNDLLLLVKLCIKIFHRVLENRHVSSIGCADKSLKSQHVLCFYVFGHSLCWSEKIFCLNEVRILPSARMQICIFEPFPAYGKEGVNLN